MGLPPPITLPGGLRADPGPGGRSSVVTYNLLTAAGVITVGDLRLTDADQGGLTLDVIRFQDSMTPAIDGASIVLYSDDTDGFDALADTTGPPSALYSNALGIPEVGPEGNNGATYTPTQGNQASSMLLDFR